MTRTGSKLMARVESGIRRDTVYNDVCNCNSMQVVLQGSSHIIVRQLACFDLINFIIVSF